MKPNYLLYSKISTDIVVVRCLLLWNNKKKPLLH